MGLSLHADEESSC